MLHQQLDQHIKMSISVKDNIANLDIKLWQPMMLFAMICVLEPQSTEHVHGIKHNNTMIRAI